MIGSVEVELVLLHQEVVDVVGVLVITRLDGTVGWLDGWMGCMVGTIVGGWMDGWMGWLHGWWLDGWLDGMVG